MLEEAVHANFQRADSKDGPRRLKRQKTDWGALPIGKKLCAVLPHMQALVDSANQDSQFRRWRRVESDDVVELCSKGAARLGRCNFRDGTITELNPGDGGEFLISGQAEWWRACFNNRIDAFSDPAGKLNCKRASWRIVAGQTVSEGICNMETIPVSRFFAPKFWKKTAARQAQKPRSSPKEEQLTFGELNRQGAGVGLASAKGGIRRRRPGRPFATQLHRPIPLSYYRRRK